MNTQPLTSTSPDDQSSPPSSPLKFAACVVVEVGESGYAVLGIKTTKRQSSGRPWTLGLPGGKVEKGESLKEAAVRELQEETGVVCQEADLVTLWEEIVPSTTGLGRCSTTTFLCRRRLHELGGTEFFTSHEGTSCRTTWEALCDPVLSPFYAYNRMVYAMLFRSKILNLTHGI